MLRSQAVHSISSTSPIGWCHVQVSNAWFLTTGSCGSDGPFLGTQPQYKTTTTYHDKDDNNNNNNNNKRTKTQCQPQNFSCQTALFFQGLPNGTWPFLCEFPHQHRKNLRSLWTLKSMFYFKRWTANPYNHDWSTYAPQRTPRNKALWSGLIKIDFPLCLEIDVWYTHSSRK